MGTKTAAQHVLASMTQKAKKLFVLLGTQQLEVMDELNPAPRDDKVALLPSAVQWRDFFSL